nr:RNA-directed DNA polymerase, eukaryota [Tanacetum cinerariifolium]
MGILRSKEDDVQQISTSVFVTNLPYQFFAKDLWNTCKQYGSHNQANNRESKNNLGAVYKDKGLNRPSNSYAHVVKGSQSQYVDSENKPTLMINDSCLNQQDFKCCLMGKVKDFASLSNLKVVLVNEGFDNIELKYMGGYWIQQASTDFFVEGSVAWVEIEGIPLNMWSETTFKRTFKLILRRMGASTLKEFASTRTSQIIFSSRLKSFIVLNGDDLNNDKDLACDSDVEAVPDTKFDDEPINSNVKEASVEKKEAHSADPFNIYDLFNKKKGGWLGFDKLVGDSWKEAVVVESNSITRMMKKLKYLKEKIRLWNKGNMVSPANKKRTIKSDLGDLNMIIDKGNGDIEAIEGDENSKYYHGILNKKRSQLAIYGILVNGVWIDSLVLVKCEFLTHFKNRFDHPQASRIQFDLKFPNMLKFDQLADLDRKVSKDEIKKAVWDCENDKSPGPDGFTFGFYRRYWKILESDVVDVVACFFHHGSFPKGSNSSFIALIPKTLDANMVKDFRPISLIGSMYKIIAKILANRLVFVLGDLVNEVQSAFVVDRQILDGLFILNEIIQWCQSKNKSNLWSLKSILKRPLIRGSVIVNGSPTEEFQFHKGLKQGDPLSPFLFILVMESLHISFQRVVDAGMFKGIMLSPSLHLSHLFYADDAIFMGQWNESNLDTIVHVLECFHHASGLRINMSKSKLMGIYVDAEKVSQAARKIGCVTLKTPFTYLGSKVGGRMSRIQSWNETIEGMANRLSKWKMKTLSIGVVLILMLKNPTWVKWTNMLVSKDKGGLGISSLYALNRALMFKWVWRFLSQNSSLWANVIKSINGDHGKIGKQVKASYPSIWLDIVKEVNLLRKQGLNLLSFIHKKLGNGSDTLFWDETWYGDITFKILFPRVYALKSCKNIDVALKLSHNNLAFSFRRDPREEWNKISSNR